MDLLKPFYNYQAQQNLDLDCIHSNLSNCIESFLSMDNMKRQEQKNWNNGERENKNPFFPFFTQFTFCHNNLHHDKDAFAYLTLNDHK